MENRNTATQVIQKRLGMVHNINHEEQVKVALAAARAIPDKDVLFLYEDGGEDGHLPPREWEARVYSQTAAGYW